jgi:heavy metal translocating P-type ATPase
LAAAPLLAALMLGGGPLIWDLLKKVAKFEFGADLLAGISIVTSVILGEYLAGVLVVLMLSGGEALESYAVSHASSVLRALAKRMPSSAHHKTESGLVEVELGKIAIGDAIVVLPHETCPVDGVVIEGRGSMDEAYLTGEPYHLFKSIGSEVLSGAINGEHALTISATKLAIDSRYAKIMEVMRDSEQKRPNLRRLGDQLGAYYTPLALAVAALAWLASGDALRFLAVLVIATPCPLLIAIPVAVIGSISLAARRGIIVRDPAILETIEQCTTMICDKTGTLTYGEPTLVKELVANGVATDEMLKLVGSLEQYSRHPLAKPVLEAAMARGIELETVDEVQEKPGQGMLGRLGGHEIRITGRNQLAKSNPDAARLLPPVAGGLEFVVLLDGSYAATYQFRDTPRAEGKSFITHLSPRHQFDRVMIVSGDRKEEVQFLAGMVGIEEYVAEASPEEKLNIVRRETQKAKTLYLGDGVNDAPAMLAASVGVAMGQRSEVTTEAAGAVILDNSLGKVDELMHIGRRMRAIALQSAVGGIALSLAGMGAAAGGWLPPVYGALLQEGIDVLAVLNALRAAATPGALSDYEGK